MVDLATAPAQQLVMNTNRDLQGRDKTAFWHSVVEDLVLDLHASANSCDPNPEVAMTCVSQERAGLVHIQSSSCRIDRQPRFGGDGWGGSIVVNIVLSGKLIAMQDGRQVHIEAGDGISCLADRPYSLCFPEAFEAVVIRFDRSYFAHLPLVAGLHLTALSRAGDVGRMVTAFASDLGRSAALLDASVNAQLTQRLAELLEAALSVTLDKGKRGTPGQRIATLSQIKAYIRDRLADPELSPRQIYSATNLPPRHLRKLFAESGTSMRQYILERRLALCASDLAAPHFRQVPISSIAFRHGFKDAGHFSRSFRAQFELTPSEYQERAMQRIAGRM